MSIKLLFVNRIYLAFIINVEYVKDLQESERMAEQKKQSMVRRYFQTWKNNAQQKAELREAEHAQKVEMSFWLGFFSPVYSTLGCANTRK